MICSLTSPRRFAPCRRRSAPKPREELAMTALPLPLPARLPPQQFVGAHTGEPVALLQLDGADSVRAASAVYRAVRLGRCVVAVVCGDQQAVARLGRQLDAIGLPALLPAPGEALIGGGVTIVAGPESAPARPLIAPTRARRVALAGCGVVGGGVLPRLLADPRFEVVGVLVRRTDKPRDVSIPEGLAVSDPGALLAREPDILVEAISDPSTGLALIRAALSRGLDVVSANKQAVGADLPGLAGLASAGGSRLLYSASVGGGAPLIETVRRARAHGPVVRIEAVLNGTCNFILNRLAAGDPFEAALAAAREAGFAEADSSADLSGRDAAAKLVILGHEASHPPLTLDDIACEPLGPERERPPGTVRQLARLDVRTGEAAVSLRCVDGDALFADLPDEWNALRVTLADGRVFSARGRGAGRTPTAESVWADLGDLAGS